MTDLPSYSVPSSSRPTEHLAAADRRRVYPYRFPTDHRRFGGNYTVEQNRAILLRFFYCERRLGGGLGSWTLSIPDFEVKLETGRHIFQHYAAARALRERLHHLEMSLEEIDAHRDADLDRLVEEALSANDTPALLAGVHLELGRALADAYRHHLATTCPVADAPTIRCLTQLLSDRDENLAWSEAAVQAYTDGGIDPARLMAWRWHLNQLIVAIGGISGSAARRSQPSLRIDSRPYVRGTVPLRDARFVTFFHTGDYGVAEGAPLRYPEGSWGSRRMEFMRTQRDEIDAIEAFGTTLWDIRFSRFETEFDLAHIVWDEVRHTEIGHRTLAASGHDPFEIASRLTSSMCRGPMDPLPAFVEINLFGEVSVLKNIGVWIGQAVEHHDALLMHAMDYVRADERTHVRKGRGVIKTMTDKTPKEIELATRKAFTACLLGLGAIESPQAGDESFVLSREQIEHLVGE